MATAQPAGVSAAPGVAVACRSPLSFEEVQTLVATDQLARLRRSPARAAEYAQFREQLAAGWESTADYVLHSKFGLPVVGNGRNAVNKSSGAGDGCSINGSEEKQDCGTDTTAGELAAAWPPRRSRRRVDRTRIDAADHPRIRLVPNDFPYNLASDVKHFVLWKLSAAATTTAVATTTTTAATTPPPAPAGTIEASDISAAVEHLRSAEGLAEFVTWVNPPAFQSVPEVAHAHIVFRVKGGSSDTAGDEGNGSRSGGAGSDGGGNDGGGVVGGVSGNGGGSNEAVASDGGRQAASSVEREAGSRAKAMPSL